MSIFLIHSPTNSLHHPKKVQGVFLDQPRVKEYTSLLFSTIRRAKGICCNENVICSYSVNRCYLLTGENILWNSWHTQAGSY